MIKNIYLQAWQAFLRRLFISQLLLTGHVYSMLPRQDKKMLHYENETTKNRLAEGFRRILPGWTGDTILPYAHEVTSSPSKEIGYSK